MRDDSGRTESIWMGVPAISARPKLTRDAQANVCVVGAGMAGLSTAYHLAREGCDVIVIDDGPVAGGESARTTAHLTNVLDDRYHWIEQVHGPEGARLAAESHGAAVDRIESIAREERIACDFRRLDAFLFVPPGDPFDELEKELEAARRAGVDVEWVERAPIAHFHTGRCLRFPKQGQFHPLRYMAGLASGIQRLGGRIHRDTRAARLDEGPPVRVVTGEGREIIADHVVIATNTPVHTRFKLHTKQAPYRTYVIAVRVPEGSVPKALYYDTPWPYHYARVHVLGAREGGGTFLIVGGEDHKTGQRDDAYERWGRLEAWTRERFPMAEDVAHRWSGQVFETVDGVAFIGQDMPRVYLATGDSGMGMTHGTIAGMILTDLIQRRENPWTSLYDPGRISLRAVGEYAKENLNVAGKYFDYLTPGDASSVDEIRRGDGAVIRHGTRKIAAYRDDEGSLHLRSAVCPHLGCIVAWNTAERTWDCPCHGSRFDPFGRVITGPSIRDLRTAEEPALEAPDRARVSAPPPPRPPLPA